MGKHPIHLSLTATDQDATLLRLCSVLHSRRAVVHQFHFDRRGDGAGVSVVVEPTTCGLGTVSESLRNVIGVQFLWAAGRTRSMNSSTLMQCGARDSIGACVPSGSMVRRGVQAPSPQSIGQLRA